MNLNEERDQIGKIMEGKKDDSIFQYWLACRHILATASKFNVSTDRVEQIIKDKGADPSIEKSANAMKDLYKESSGVGQGYSTGNRPIEEGKPQKKYLGISYQENDASANMDSFLLKLGFEEVGVGGGVVQYAGDWYEDDLKNQIKARFPKARYSITVLPMEEEILEVEPSEDCKGCGAKLTDKEKEDGLCRNCRKLAGIDEQGGGGGAGYAGMPGASKSGKGYQVFGAGTGNEMNEAAKSTITLKVGRELSAKNVADMIREMLEQYAKEKGSDPGYAMAIEDVANSIRVS